MEDPDINTPDGQMLAVLKVVEAPCGGRVEPRVVLPDIRRVEIDCGPRRRVGVHKCLHSTRVVVVAVGQKDLFQLQTASSDHLQDPLRGPAGVHHGAHALRLIANQIAVGVDLPNRDGIKNHGLNTPLSSIPQGF